MRYLLDSSVNKANPPLALAASLIGFSEAVFSLHGNCAYFDRAGFRVSVSSPGINPRSSLRRNSSYLERLVHLGVRPF